MAKLTHEQAWAILVDACASAHPDYRLKDWAMFLEDMLRQGNGGTTLEQWAEAYIRENDNLASEDAGERTLSPVALPEDSNVVAAYARARE